MRESVIQRRNELEHECESEPSEMTKMEHGLTSKLKLMRGLKLKLGTILQLRLELKLDAMCILESKVKLEKEMGMEIEQVELQLKQELKLAPEREYELEHELASITELERELERHQGQELDQIIVMLKRELEWTLERELELEHKLANKGEQRRGLERQWWALEPMDEELRWELQLTLERKSELQDKLASIAEQRRKLGLEPMDVKPKRELERLLAYALENKLRQERELVHKIERVKCQLYDTMTKMMSGLFRVKDLKSEWHDLEDMLKQAQQLDDEPESTQEWMGWVENVLMLKRKGNLMVKKYRWLRLKRLKLKLKQQLEQWLKNELDNLRRPKRMLTREEHVARNMSWPELPERKGKWQLWERYLKLMKDKKWEISMVKEFLNEAFTFEACTNIPKGFHVNEVNGDICFCFSPEGKWVMEADGPNICNLQTRNRELSCNHGTPEHIISKVTRFSFTNDDLYFVYLSDDGSLHALSLQTGTVLTSVSGSNDIYFTKQRQCGYLFRSNTEEKAILLSNLFSPFKFISVSPVEPSVVGKSIAVV